MIEIRNEYERRKEVLPIISKLNEFKINIKDDNMKILYEKFNYYIKNGERTKINILLPTINRKIIGVLEVKKSKESVIRLTTNF